MVRLSLEKILEPLDFAEDFESLRVSRDHIHEELQQSYPLSSDPVDWNEAVNSMHDSLIRRVVAIAEHRLKADGAGTPPVPYAFILLGSGGRREQTLWSDQDNGLVYSDPAEGQEQAASEYFEALSRTIIDGLCQVGYPPCEGEVVSTNSLWRKPLSGWKQRLSEWLNEPNWENMRYILITADLRCIYGEEALVEAIRQFLYARVNADKKLLEYMLKNTLHRKMSLGIFGQLITERYGEDAGGIDIKYGAYIPIVNGIRLLAIKAGLSTSNTLERINGLAAAGQFDVRLADELRQVFSQILRLRSLTPSQLEDGYYSSRGILPHGMLNKEVKHHLKLALKEGTTLQKYVQKVIRNEIDHR